MAAWGQTGYTFSDGGKKAAYQLSATEVFSSRQVVPSARAVSEWGRGKVYTLSSASAVNKVRRAKSNRGSIVPVFYYKGDLPSAAKRAAISPADRARRMDGARRLGTPKLLVHMDDSRFAELAATKPTGMEKSLLDGWILVVFADAFAALDAADWMIRNGGWEFTPVFARESFTRQALQRPVNDSLYPKQWHLTGTSFNLNMKNAWDQVTGKGINIAVIDDALEIKHEDFINAYPLESGYHHNFKEDGAPNDPSPRSETENHGTYCGGLAVAAGFNNIGVAGVAPEARVMGLRYVGGAVPDDASSIALSWQPAGIQTHVSSNSWGPADDAKSDGRVSSLQLAGMEKAVTANRNGLGTVISVSCGNGRDSGDDASYDAFSGSRFAIAVAAAGRDGTQSSYSENGMSVAITAFGGEYQPPDVLWSTNVSGAEAFDLKAANFPTTESPVNYTDTANGTSSAAPQVSGAAALLLEKNPKLGYRDVKEILMKSAEFVRNGGGFFFSHSFGAGLLNVSGALALASNWTNLGPLLTAEASGTGGPIADDASLRSVRFDLSSARIRVEHVEVTVNVKHANRGDLGFFIESPSGMRAIADNRAPDDGADFADYTFTTPRFWGESAAGVWKFGVLDVQENGTAGELVDVKIKVYGTSP
ncbi:MAG TPA: S8 family serine peptidase [Bryobacteraceae bacterium]|nr:S8 family serine peptidase [Bryobacteraceae bacterium]